MLEKLKAFGVKKGSVQHGKLEANLALLEEHCGVLPAFYKDFLRYSGISILLDVNVVFKSTDPSPWADDKGHDVLESLYGLCDGGKDYTLLEAFDTYKDAFKNKWLPIGASSGDNQICMCLDEELVGQIWFWDHESASFVDNTHVTSGLTFIAKSFEEFVQMLECRDDDIDTSGVIGVELDF